MAAKRWTAQVFVNSEVGTIQAEVYAATIPGAHQQIRAKYGPVTQVVNLREQNDRTSSSSGGGGGCGTLLLIGMGIAVLAMFGGESDSPSPVAPSGTYDTPIERVETPPAPQFKDYASPEPTYCVTENFEPC